MRSVVRPIVDYDDLDVLERLDKQRIDRLTDEFGAVVCWYDDGENGHDCVEGCACTCGIGRPDHGHVSQPERADPVDEKTIASCGSLPRAILVAASGGLCDGARAAHGHRHVTAHSMSSNARAPSTARRCSSSHLPTGSAVRDMSRARRRWSASRSMVPEPAGQRTPTPKSSITVDDSPRSPNTRIGRRAAT